MKEKILDKATNLFLNLGFKSVTMDDIAAELGVSKKTIYTHYSNKTSLVAAVATSIFESIKCEVDIISASDINPIEEVYEVKKVIMGHLKDQKASPQFQLQKYYPKIAASLHKKQFEVMQGCVLRNLEKGIALKLFRPTIHMEFISRIYFHGMAGLKDNELFPLQYFSMNDLMDFYLEYHLRGICTEKGRALLDKLLTHN